MLMQYKILYKGFQTSLFCFEQLLKLTREIVNTSLCKSVIAKYSLHSAFILIKLFEQIHCSLCTHFESKNTYSDVPRVHTKSHVVEL